MSVYMGIDPGSMGGVVALDDSGSVLFAERTPRLGQSQPDIRGMLDLLYCGSSAPEADAGMPWPPEDVRVAIERVTASPQAGARSMFTFGENYGMWRAAVAAMRYPCELVQPQAWQRACAPLPSDRAKRKERIVAAARERWPGLPIHAKKDWGIADAAWIAEHQRKAGVARGSRA